MGSSPTTPTIIDLLKTQKPITHTPRRIRQTKSWGGFIDHWAVDWMFTQHEEETEEDDTFHNMNQRYRTRKEPKLELSMSYEYPIAGKYNVLVKVIDIFGNDTTKLIEVKV